MLVKLAWRNIWRSKRRTIITLSAITFAVFIASVLQSFQKGTWDKIIESSINSFFGYAQVHGVGYWDEQTLDNAIDFDENINNLHEGIAEVNDLVPRIESFALASQGNLTTGVMVIGIDPVKEDEMTGIKSRMVEGVYLKSDDDGAIIGSGLAEKLSLEIGDSLILISQGYHGVNAAGKFPIKGIFKFALPDLNKKLVYLSLPGAQYFYGAEGKITSLVLKIDGQKEVPRAVLAANKTLDKNEFEVIDWEKMIPQLVETRELKEGSSNLILYILYFIISFALFGTILMMSKEREHEFGILVSIGMQRWQMALGVWLETIFLGLIGAIAGILLSMPICYYFMVNPIDMGVMGGEELVEVYENFGIEPVLPFAFDFKIFLEQAIIMFIITTILALYPLWSIFKLKPVEAMRA